MDTFLGGSAQVVWRTRKDGNLWIFVERVRRANGTVVTTVTYQRSKYCASHGEDFGCAVVWTQKRRIPNRSFVIDTSLRAASLRDTLFGQPVRVTWRPFGTPTTQVNENGSRYMHSRDAAADTTWGPMHYVERENIEASMIYHRIADAAKS